MGSGYLECPICKTIRFVDVSHSDVGSDAGRYRVRCSDCMVTGWGRQTKEDAIKYWNDIPREEQYAENENLCAKGDCHE